MKFLKELKNIINKILNKYPDLCLVIAFGRTRPTTIKIHNSLGIIDRRNTESLHSYWLCCLRFL